MLLVEDDELMITDLENTSSILRKSLENEVVNLEIIGNLAIVLKANGELKGITRDNGFIYDIYKCEQSFDLSSEICLVGNEDLGLICIITKEIILTITFDFSRVHLPTFAISYYNETPIHFVGSISFYLKEELKECLSKYGLSAGNIIRKPIDGLLKYHQKKL